MLDQVIVSMEGLSRRWGDLAAVDDITLNVPRGKILGVIGPSGSGKTTLIRMLTGTLEPTTGTLSVLGQHPRKFTRRTRERIGYMPQHFVLYEELTAAENVSFVASLFGLLWPKRGRRVAEVLKLVELWDARGRRARHLSGGMQRRLELACALVHEPVLLFVDEPTAGLDPMLRQKVWAEFRRLRELGRTLVVTTQYVAEAEYCDTVAVLARGRLIALAAPDELRSMALGGEVIEIETAEAFDGTRIEQVPGVRAVRQGAPRRFLVISDDAGAATPRVLEELNAAGIHVISSSEYRPSFDEVFATLVSQSDESGTDFGDAEEGKGLARNPGSVSRAA
ncbi:MAG TPA: ABC transporter ATP-binding protein [Chloroflexota bacterium]|nr:ABC transporter ATP-binding protein [Chloroflexota bacterium]